MLVVILAASILLMVVFFVSALPTLASEDIPDPSTDGGYPFGCICTEGPIVFRCCDNLIWYPEMGRYICDGGWYYIGYNHN